MEQNQINSVLKDTITAISTPNGTGGIAVIRVSGPEAIEIVNKAWKGVDLRKVNSHTAHHGKYVSTDNDILDECVATVFKAPASFTGENVVEISVHGSSWIQKEIINDLVRRNVRVANPGEFTQRAFFNGRLDLAQAEGVADLIASSSKAAHDLALSQIKGSFSKEFNHLRQKLIEFASLLELELDFSEEDIEFANRDALLKLCTNIQDKIKSLTDSYSRGAAIKDGVPVVIAGKPNAGKSSILNLLLNEEKAIVTDIPGTTRDIIEATREYNGILYRFIDTAGLRETDDIVESIGVDKAKTEIDKSFIIIWVIDNTEPLDSQVNEIKNYIKKNPSKPIVTLLNKSDLKVLQTDDFIESMGFNTLQSKNLSTVIPFSTKYLTGHNELLVTLHKIVTDGADTQKDIILTNARHYEALVRASESLQRIFQGLQDSLSADFIAQDTREAIANLATITGSITTDTLLHSIFSRFCIGK